MTPLAAREAGRVRACRRRGVWETPGGDRRSTRVARGTATAVPIRFQPPRTIKRPPSFAVCHTGSCTLAGAAARPWRPQCAHEGTTPPAGGGMAGAETPPGRGSGARWGGACRSGGATATVERPWRAAAASCHPLEAGGRAGTAVAHAGIDVAAWTWRGRAGILSGSSRPPQRGRRVGLWTAGTTGWRLRASKRQSI